MSFHLGMNRAIAAALGIAVGLSAHADDAKKPPAESAPKKPAPPAVEPPKKNLPLPGQVFLVEGRPAFLIPAAANDNAKQDDAKQNDKPRDDKQNKSSAGKSIPWVWYAPTLPGLPGGEERWMFERFVKAGIAVAGIDVGESYGSPAGRKLFTAMYREMTDRRGHAPRPVLLGRSRGGLMTLCWAAENADKVGGFAGIYPVCNLASWPGLAQASGAYGLSAQQLETELKQHNPIDRLGGLAKAKAPLFAVHGDVDKVVPLEANSGELAKRYKELGGSMQLVVPPGQGHSMWAGFFQCQELVDFVLKHAK